MSKIDWSTEKNFKDQVLRLWERGDLLREKLKELCVHQTEIASLFPLRLSLKSPSSGELADRFDEVRQWIAQLSTIKLLHIEWRELNHRVLGKQKIPQSISLASLDDAIRFIAKHKEEKQFIAIISSTQDTHPELLAWLQKRPLQAISLHQEWSRLLAIVTWMKQHPQPGIYVRQIDIAGVHSKFIETHRRVIGELLDLTLPLNAINRECTGVNQFAARYYFLDKPQRLRFRSLDTNLNLIDGTKLADISLDTANFARLALIGTRIFITENETNFLAFPAVENALLIFGAGYGWDALAHADWLHHCDIYYWGDIDTHGFAILNQLRHRFPHVRSFLMDEGTLLAHQNLWGKEEQSVSHTLPLLTPEEAQVFKRLQENHLQDHLRLEQEHIRFSVLLKALATIQ
ncbi:MAG: Wadjet anti-phage system protein JetD domain-containing protein [Candidatus Aquirickettsiella gammari]